MKAFFSVLLTLLLSFGFSGNAWAHSVETDYFLLDQAQLEIKAQFSSGEPFQQAPIKIYAPVDSAQPWIEGTTDAQGHFTFVPDPSIQGEWTVRIGELDHSDILTVPVTASGVHADEISEGLPQGDRQWVAVGLMALGATVGTRMLSATFKHVG